jgi:serine/threonine protein phosphatase PrpC
VSLILSSARSAPRVLKFLSVGRTHEGRVRALNEDAFLNRPDIGLWAVADGMGGHDHGEVASGRVIEELSRVGAADSAFAFCESVTEALGRANEALAGAAGQMSGATVVALMAYQDHFSCVWAGDSRAYLYRRGALRRLTRDHSFVKGLVDAGSLSE